MILRTDIFLCVIYAEICVNATTDSYYDTTLLCLEGVSWGQRRRAASCGGLSLLLYKTWIFCSPVGHTPDPLHRALNNLRTCESVMQQMEQTDS